MDAPHLDLELTRLIERGDRRRAATMLVERFASDVYALCRAMVRDSTLAEDLAQDAFGRAITALESFRGEASPRTWLLKIARNRCLDHLAHAKRSPIDTHLDHDVDAHVEDAPPAIDLMVRREDAQRALAALAETERAIVVLHFGHGVGYPELAEAFAMKEGAVRMRVSRAVARMREALEVERTAASPMAAPASVPVARKSAGGVLDTLGRWVRGGRPAATSRDEASSRDEGERFEAEVGDEDRLERPPPPAAPRRMAPPSAAAPPRLAAGPPHPLHETAPGPLLGRLWALLDAMG